MRRKGIPGRGSLELNVKTRIPAGRKRRSTSGDNKSGSLQVHLNVFQQRRIGNHDGDVVDVNGTARERDRGSDSR